MSKKHKRQKEATYRGRFLGAAAQHTQGHCGQNYQKLAHKYHEHICDVLLRVHAFEFLPDSLFTMILVHVLHIHVCLQYLTLCTAYFQIPA